MTNQNGKSTANTPTRTDDVSEVGESAHMSPDEFRKHGHAVIDWLADYMQNVESYPVLSQVAPGDVRAALPTHPPLSGQPFDEVFAQTVNTIMPGLTHWQSPNFFAYFPANASGPAILGDLLASGLGVQGMLWATSPACTEVETHVLDWLVQMLGLPEKFLSSSEGGGVIQDTASSATLCALLAARERATQFASNRTGADGSLTAYTSVEAHSSIEKGAKIAGIGEDNLHAIASDENFAMRVDALVEAIEADIAAAKRPFFVSATVGTTSSGAIDPLRKIAAICKRHGMWLHVDGAHAGTAALVPEYRGINDGLELADSYCFNPHKWMLTNFDCDCFFIADRAALIRTLSVLPEYLKNQATASGAVFDYRDWHIPLGRRFRALKLWFVIHHYGVNGLLEHVRAHVEMAREFAGWVAASQTFELMAPIGYGLVCFRHVDGDEVNQKIMDTLNRAGKIYITHTRLHGHFTLRMAIGATTTTRKHVVDAWQIINDTAPSLR